MRTLEYACSKCGKREFPVGSVHDPEPQIWCHECKQIMEWTPTSVPLGRFKYDPSKSGGDTGVYEYDWGTRATWDLTVPGKMARLERDGRIPRDPFDDFDEKVRTGKAPAYQPALTGPDPLEG